ncbi:MAG TPA: dihydrofolate reductase family protein [Solirubrobacteraceae bacterium]|nr:dihydrofolate reductase family protein [Solirubrobacteraceae bacterium]
MDQPAQSRACAGERAAREGAGPQDAAPAGGGPPASAHGDTPRFERLAAAGAAQGAAHVIEELGLWQRPAGERARLLLNMVSTADGRATLGGRSGPISADADRALFHELRGAVDAVLVGAGTVRAERYGRIIPDPARRALRRSRGLSEEPLACIVSGRMALDGEIPLLAAPSARVVVLTASAASLPGPAAHVEYVRAARDGALDLPTALAELHQRFGVRLMLCEGGPHLACQLLADGLVDELFLTLSPKLAGGAGHRGTRSEGPGRSGSQDAQALRILAGEELQPPVELELLGVLRSGASLFLRYRVPARERQRHPIG